MRSETYAIAAPSGDHAGARSCILGVPVSARTAPVAIVATRISLRLRSPRGVNTYATSVRSGETVGAPLVAVCFELAVGGREPPRPRVGDVDDGEPRRVAALDRDEQGRVVDPRRLGRLEQLARRPAGGGDEPDVVAVAVRDPRAVGREPRLRVLPVRHRVASRGEPARRGVVEVEQPHVGRVAVLDEDRVAAVGAERERARPLRRGDRLEPPVRRRGDVAPRLDRDALGLVLAHPDRSVSHRGPPPVLS